MAKNQGDFIVDFISGRKIKASPEEVEAVQVFARQLVEDYNYPKICIQTRPQFRVKARPSDIKKEYPVDIAVFKDSKKQEENLYIIAECKKKTRKDGKTQLQDYLRFSKAFLGVWFNGEERLFLRKTEKAGRVEFEEIPNIPKFQQRLEDVGKFKRKDLKPTHNLKATFKAVRNHLAANAVGATRDEVLAQQLINLIFCKIYDEKHTKPNDIVSFRAGVGESAAAIQKRILDLFKKVRESYKDILDESDKISLDKNSTAYVIGELQNYCLMEAKRDVVADAFEVFTGHALKGGQGQFFTPRNVVQMTVDILDPQEDDLVIDPACGSGGFLIEALKHAWAKTDKKGKEYGWPQSEINRQKHKAATENFRGIDKDYFLSKVTKAYMTLMGDGAAGTVCDDSLKNPKNWKPSTRQKVRLGGYDILMTNPPFGAKIPVRGEEKIKQFDIGYKWKFDGETGKWVKTNKVKEREEPQILFIERCLSFLKDGGKMAIVLPDGALGNEKEAYLRQYIQEKGAVFAVVKLPFETFSPHVTVNASVLFIQKGAAKNKDVFISINKYCGHDKKGRPVPQDDIACVSRFYKTKKETETDFFIKPALLENNFTAKRYLGKYTLNLERIRKSKYQTADFADIVASVHNGANIDGASAYVPKGEGVPYILVKAVTKEGVNFENLKYIKKPLSKDAVKNTVNERTIIMTRAGKPGIAANIPPDLIGAVASGFLMNIRLKSGVNPYYIVAFLNSEYGRKQLERTAGGSVLQSVRSSDLKKLKIILPPADIQKSIGDKLKHAVRLSAAVRQKVKEAEDDVRRLGS